MLFMQGPLGVEGKSFIELIPHEEVKDRLRSIINKTVATSTSAECLHAFLPAVVLCVSTAAVGRSLQHSESTSESLAAMLFMQGPRGVEGKSVMELIPHEDDKDRLRSIINKSVATSTNADCLHVHMRDAPALLF